MEGLRRYEGRENPNYVTHLKLFRPLGVRSKILTLLPKTYPLFALINFQRGLSFPRTLLCPLCLQILDKPVETTCQHYFCVECMKGVIDSGQKGSCPVCKENIGPLKVLTRMVLRLIAKQEVICTTCCKSVNYENSDVHACKGAAQAPAVIPQSHPETAQTLQWNMPRQHNFNQKWRRYALLMWKRG